MIVLDIVTTVCIGLMIGTEFAVSAFINPVLRKLDDLAQARAIHLFARRLGRAMPFWYVAGLLLIISEAIVRRQESGEWLLITASVIWTAVIVHTILVLVPINNRMTRLDSDVFTPQAKREHEKWDRLHRLRVVALIAAMVCILVAIHI